MKVRTLKELKDLLNHCEDDEPFTLIWERRGWFGTTQRIHLEITGATSTAGGRAVNLWLDEVQK